MAKYNELLKKYSQEIEEIKALQASNQKLEDVIEAQTVGYDYPEHLVAELNTQLTKEAELRNQLDNCIDAEYHEVPFKATRVQGIKKFYELSGL